MPINPFSPSPRAALRVSLSRVRERAGVRALPFREAGATAAVILGGLLALDLLGFVASVYFSAELLAAAEAAGVAGLLPI